MRSCATLSRMGRNQDTSAATAANIRRKHERWIGELRQAGYVFGQLGDPPATPSSGLQLYATNSLGETYRVVGWTEGRLPVLGSSDSSDNETFIGHFRYMYTVGPKK